MGLGFVDLMENIGRQYKVILIKTPPNSKEYDNNYDNIFRNKEKDEKEKKEETNENKK